MSPGQVFKPTQELARALGTTLDRITLDVYAEKKKSVVLSIKVDGVQVSLLTRVY